MTDAERIERLEANFALLHEYNLRLRTMLKCHDELLKIAFDRLGLRWETVELPEPPSSIN